MKSIQSLHESKSSDSLMQLRKLLLEEAPVGGRYKNDKEEVEILGVADGIVRYKGPDGKELSAREEDFLDTMEPVEKEQ